MPLITCPDCASQVSDAAPSCPKCGRPIAVQQVKVAPDQKPIAVYVKQRTSWVTWLIGGSFALCCFSSVIVNAVKQAPAAKAQAESDVIGGTAPKGTPVTVVPTAPAKVDPGANKRFEECRAKLKKAAELDLLREFDWKGGGLPPHVVVGPTFATVPFNTKQGLADTLNCFLMVGQAKFIGFDLLDWQTGKVVATYSAGRLKVE